MADLVSMIFSLARIWASKVKHYEMVFFEIWPTVEVIRKLLVNSSIVNLVN